MNQSSDETAQLELASALLNPALYGTDVRQVEKIETHISFVFLAGAWAYKVKKAVDLGFLDFSTLRARRFYCLEELRLNRRLAPALYLDVVAITGSPREPAFGGDGPAIEYAVRMKRFSQDQLFDRLLERNQLTVQHIDQLAAKVAGFHAGAARSAAGTLFGAPEAIRKPALENFSQIASMLSDAPDLAGLQLLRTWTERQCGHLEYVFTERKENGFIRECHGDLHLGNIALVDGETTMFDCIEFSSDLRWIDVASEAAFVVMDLRVSGRPALAWRFLNGYLEKTGDYAALRVLRFYVVYRAMVRAKVALMRSRQSGPARDQKDILQRAYRAHIALANTCMARATPALIVTHGLSGSGKTTLTQSLVEITGALRIRSDVERKRLCGLPAIAATGSTPGHGLYSEDMSGRTYERLRSLARTILDAGYPVIVDATFLERHRRDAFHELARSLGVPFIIIDFVAPEQTLRNRIVDRQARHQDASEADLATLDLQIATQQPLEADELPWVIPCNTEMPDTGENPQFFWRPLLERLAAQPQMAG